MRLHPCSCVLLALALQACGGGSGDATSITPESLQEAAPAAPAAPPAAHADNGDYRVVGSTQTVLRMDFDKGEWQLEQASADKSTGTFVPTPDGFSFLPSNSTGTNGTNTLRFTAAGGAIVGVLPTASPAPFIAVREFVRDFDAIQGSYFVETTITSAHPEPPRTMLQVVEIVGRKLRLGGSESELSLEGDLFTTTLRNVDPYGFRVARVGSTRLLVLQRMPGFYKFEGSGVDTAAVVHAPQLQAQVFSADGWGELTLTPERLALRTTRPDGTQRAIAGTNRNVHNPPARPSAGYVFDTDADGGWHSLSVTSTADLVWYEYSAPWSNPSQPPKPTSLADPPRRGIGRVRR